MVDADVAAVAVTILITMIHYDDFFGRIAHTCMQ